MSELYGPAYAIIMTQTDIHGLWIDGKMNDVNFKVKQYLNENNNKIIGLIITHLIEGAEMPDCFVRFLQTQLCSVCTLRQRKMVRSS